MLSWGSAGGSAGGYAPLRRFLSYTSAVNSYRRLISTAEVAYIVHLSNFIIPFHSFERLYFIRLRDSISFVREIPFHSFERFHFIRSRDSISFVWEIILHSFERLQFILCYFLLYIRRPFLPTVHSYGGGARGISIWIYYLYSRVTGIRLHTYPSLSLCSHGGPPGVPPPYDGSHDFM